MKKHEYEKFLDELTKSILLGLNANDEDEDDEDDEDLQVRSDYQEMMEWAFPNIQPVTNKQALKLWKKFHPNLPKVIIPNSSCQRKGQSLFTFQIAREYFKEVYE